MSNPPDKDKKVDEFRNDIIKTKGLKRTNVWIMDESGLYSNSVPPFMWVDENDNEAYVR